jgi:hypothetical protein
MRRKRRTPGLKDACAAFWVPVEVHQRLLKCQDEIFGGAALARYEQKRSARSAEHYDHGWTFEVENGVIEVTMCWEPSKTTYSVTVFASPNAATVRVAKLIADRLTGIGAQLFGQSFDRFEPE